MRENGEECVLDAGGCVGIEKGVEKGGGEWDGGIEVVDWSGRAGGVLAENGTVGCE